jgi:hypothetical protein
MSDANPLGSVEVAQSPAERYEEFLQSRGKRMTQPKRKLLEQVYNRHEHFDAESLIEQLPAAGQKGHIANSSWKVVLSTSMTTVIRSTTISTAKSVRACSNFKVRPCWIYVMRSLVSIAFA